MYRQLDLFLCFGIVSAAGDQSFFNNPHEPFPQNCEGDRKFALSKSNNNFAALSYHKVIIFLKISPFDNKKIAQATLKIFFLSR